MARTTAQSEKIFSSQARTAVNSNGHKQDRLYAPPNCRKFEAFFIFEVECQRMKDERG